MFEFAIPFDTIEAHTVLSGNAPLTSTRKNRAVAAENLSDEHWEIYRAKCVPSGKSYIGLTKSGHEMRWYHHVRNARIKRRTGVLHSAIQKHGANAFEIEILYIAGSEREAIAVERGLIAQYGTLHPNGYNLTSGGETFKGVKNPRRKISQAHIEHLRRLAAEMKGKQRDRAAVEKGAAKIRGKPNGRKGRKDSPETLVRKRLAQQAIAHTRLGRLRGNGITAAERAKRSVSQKASWADPVRREARLARFRAAFAAKAEAKCRPVE